MLKSLLNTHNEVWIQLKRTFARIACSMTDLKSLHTPSINGICFIESMILEMKE